MKPEKKVKKKKRKTCNSFHIQVSELFPFQEIKPTSLEAVKMPQVEDMKSREMDPQKAHLILLMKVILGKYEWGTMGGKGRV